MGRAKPSAPALIIDPREGKVAGPGGEVRLEPRVMEALEVFAKHPGHVVTREELMDTVWPGVIVTEHTLNRCIYQLRNELSKIGMASGQIDYEPIETLPKRGYRLAASIEVVSADRAATPADSGIEMPAIPFVVGQWVRGNRFYGRTAQISEILEGHRNCIWLLGTRRIGKTSLLKQLEYIAETAEHQRYLPIFWDFQGAGTPSELHLNFADALVDADERLERIGISLADVEAEDLFVSLGRLRRLLSARKLQLLLLCDEVEELIELHRKDPSLLRKLRHAMQSREDIRTVLASTIRLWALAEQQEDTSPFLHGFTPPLYIERFSGEEARSLIRQAHLSPEQRPDLTEGVVDAIRDRCDNHPYLLQLICKRYLETGDLEEAIEQVATDRMVSHFFSVDFNMLSKDEGEIIRMIASQSVAAGGSIREELSAESDVLDGNLRRLENLGFIRRDEERRFVLANYFFRRWLQQTQDYSVPPVTPAVPIPLEDTGAPGVDGDDKRSAGGFIAEMKRRNVFRVGIAYVVVAWLLLQIGEIAFDFLEVPGWAGKLLIVLLALGLPVALLLAWAYELTPKGMKRESEVDRSNTTTRQVSRKLDFVIIAILAMALLFFALDKFT